MESEVIGESQDFDADDAVRIVPTLATSTSMESTASAELPQETQARV